MGNLYFGYDLVDPDTLTPSSEDASYPIENVSIYNHTLRHYRAQVETEVTIVIDFAAAKSIECVFLNDVNFVNVFIAGNTADSWGAPAFSEVEFAIGNDVRVNRRKVIAVLTGFNYRYMRLRIPAQSATDGLGVFRIGTACFCDSKLEISKNPELPYKFRAEYAEHARLEFGGGGHEKIKSGDHKIFSADMKWKNVSRTDEADLWTLDAIKNTEHIVFFENLGNTYEAYLVQKDNNIDIEWNDSENARTGFLHLDEIF